MNSILEASVTGCHPASVPDYTPVPLLRDLQLQRMKAVVARASQHVKLFQSRMNDRGLVPEDIRSLDDIAKLPFTVKSDLRDTYPFGLFASPMKDVVRLHVSSGTTGKPIVVSLQKFAELRAPGWECDPSRLERETGYTCATTLQPGVAAALTWYRQQHWL